MRPNKVSNWLYNENGNYILYGDGYFISYNPSTKYTFQRNRKGARYRAEPDCEETALYISETNSWLVLNGDFRREYEICETIGQCKTTFRRYAPRYRSKFCSGIDSL